MQQIPATKNRIWIVVPCYNEEAVLNETSQQLKKLFDKLIANHEIAGNSRILFVDDGSSDHSWEIIQKLNQNHLYFTGIKLSKNKGHQTALWAGLMHVRKHADAAISLDADLQDDIQCIPQMIEAFKQGNEIVYGVRISRKSDSFFKRKSAQAFYRLMKMLGVELIYNHADFRLMSYRALKALSKFNETNLFLRGIVPTMGFTSTTVSYERKKRFAGKSKYSLRKMISFMFEGLTSFSIKPIRLILVIGLAVSLISLLMLAWIIVQYHRNKIVEGWSSIMVSIWFLGGLLIFSIGLIGEYIAKLYSESKHRPRFFIEEKLK